MEIELKKIAVRELTDGYVDTQEEGVRGYGGKLDIRPVYQREFVYTGRQREAVIQTALSGFPLNVMYWAVREDGTYEIIDGQQRTISLCQYIEGEYSVIPRGGDNPMYFQNLREEQKKRILDYELMIYFCTGNHDEKIDWFRIVNIAGEKLEPQEIRNAVYSGSWVNDAKRHFSRGDSPIKSIGNLYLNGKLNRQDYLETAIKWISNGDITGYMAKHQKDSDAKELWKHFKKVIDWVEATFHVCRKKEMKGLDWGRFYRDHHNKKLDPEDVEKDVKALMGDREVLQKRGIYEYILTGEERCLNLRTFEDDEKRTLYERQNGVCVRCKKKFDIEEMEADHIDPWSKGGKTEIENGQMLCRPCNRRKSNK